MTYTGCTFNISSGIKLTMNSSVGCFNCTFNGGNVIVSAGFAFTGGTLNVDSVAFNNTSAALYPYAATGGTSFTNGKVGFNVPLTCQVCSFTNETVHIDIASAQTFTLQASGGYNTSTFGHDWTLVGEVKAGAFQSTYSIDDPKAQTRDNYYRLQQVDRVG